MGACSIVRSSTRPLTVLSLAKSRVSTGGRCPGNLGCMNPRIQSQIAFLAEADKLKSVPADAPRRLSRLENSAEHSWHLVLVVMVLGEYGLAGIDWMRVMEMVAVHDLVEIDAGDVSAYDVDALAAKAQREQAAASGFSGSCRQISENDSALCGMSSKRARLLKRALRMQSIVCSRCSRTNILAAGAGAVRYSDDEQILRRMAPIEAAMPDVWPHVVLVVETFCPVVRD